jgi:O-antigen ligase
MHRTSNLFAPTKLQTFCLLGLTVLLALLPLPFGSNRLWASNLLGIGCGLLLLGIVWLRISKPGFWPQGAPQRTLNGAVALYGAAVLWGWLQSQSWLPTAWDHPVWRIVPASAGAISLTPDRAAECGVRMLSYLAIFLAALFIGRDGRHAKLLIKILAITGAAYAFYGLWEQASGNAAILGIPKTAYREFVTATFINKNSYATYAGLGLICCLALLWDSLKHGPKQASQTYSLQSLWLHYVLRRQSFLIVLTLLVAGALILTSSRAGIFSSIVACLIFIVLLAVNRRWRWTQWLPSLVIALFVLSLLILLSGNFLLDRLEQDQLDAASAIRLSLYESTLRAIADRPLLGHGLGSFTEAVRLHAGQPTSRWFNHAHNDYLEMALELGLPVTLTLLTAVVLLLIACWRGVLRRGHLEICPILALSASILVGVHGLFDFSLQIPAVTVTYAALLGLGVAQSWPQLKRN